MSGAPASINTATLAPGTHTIAAVFVSDGADFTGSMSTVNGGYGLTGMRERVLALGGQLTVESAPSRGTRVTAELPLNVPIEQRRLMSA